jgi:hypothetical protein
MTDRYDSPHSVCREFEQDLVLYYYGECGEAERNKVETHLRGCPSCGRFLEELRSLLSVTIKADEPPQAFWEGYSREIRRKLAAATQKVEWWKALVPIFRPWPVPALATTLILALALTLSFTKGPWRSHQSTPQEEELLEVARAGENLEFFKSLDFLDSMDLLEAVEGKEIQENESSRRAL